MIVTAMVDFSKKKKLMSICKGVIKMRESIALKNVIGSAECPSCVVCDKCNRKMFSPETYHITHVDYIDYTETLDLCNDCFKEYVNSIADGNGLNSIESYVDLAPEEIVNNTDAVDFYCVIREIESKIRKSKFIVEGEVETRPSDAVMLDLLNDALKKTETIMSLYVKMRV